MSGSQVELAWRTGGEDDNLGFIVEKRVIAFTHIFIFIYICIIYFELH